MKDVPISRARETFPELSSRVHYRKRRVVITRRGKEWVAVVPMEDLEVLQALEDQIDLADAKKTLRDAKKNGTIPWSKLKKQLGL